MGSKVKFYLGLLLFSVFFQSATIQAQTACQFGPGGRWVVTVYKPPYETVQIGTSDRACAVQLVRDIYYKGIRSTNPYTRNAQVWAGNYFELVDVNDPQGAQGTAKAIVKEALPNVVGLP